MKRLCLMLSILLLLSLVACGQRGGDPSSDNKTAALMQNGAVGFFRADDDFVKTNFGAPAYLKNAAVYLSEKNDGTEFGFFELTDAKYREEMMAAIRDYLASEEQSVRSLAALYPADDLQARLERFGRATVKAEGDVVYYFLTDSDIYKR